MKKINTLNIYYILLKNVIMGQITNTNETLELVFLHKSFIRGRIFERRMSHYLLSFPLQ